MKSRQSLRPIELFLGCLIVSIFFLFLSVKMWGKRLLEEDSFRQELTFKKEMTVSEFGRINRLSHPLLKKVFSLTSKKDFQKKLKDSNLLQNEISRRVNKELFLRVKDENSFVKFFKWTIRRLLHNFGWGTQEIQRSGQPGMMGLWLHDWLFPFKSVINLAWDPERHKEQVYELSFCKNRNIDYYCFSWKAAGPKDWSEVDRVIELIDHCKKPVWIHCGGGKDRTGGLLALWKKRKGYPIELVLRDFETYGIPAFPWVQKLLREGIGLLSQIKGVSVFAKIETDRIDDGILTHLGMADLVLKPNIPREVNIDGTEWGAIQRRMIPFDKYTPQLQSKGDKIYYVWEESDGKHRQIWTASVHEDGTGWKSGKRTKSLYGKYDPQFQIVGNIIYYVWYEDHGPIEPIWVAEEILIK